MESKEDLNQFINSYQDNPFHDENVRGLARFVNYCLEFARDAQNYLELGIGHGITLQQLSQNFQHVVVLEGSSELVTEYTHKYPNVKVIETYFEEFESDEKFANIGMGFILEHVEDPVGILTRFKKMLAPEGRILVGVPSASSLHRLLALRAGMLADLRLLSETDLAFGHKRLWTYQDWCDLFHQTGLTIETARGLAFKPFSTGQLQQLQLDLKIVTAMDDFAADYPEFSNALFFVLSAG